MSSLKTKAPGKLFIAGEYSVLFGGKALVAAVDRFAEAEFTPHSHHECWVRYHTHWEREDSHPLWLSMLKAAREFDINPAVGIYKLDTHNFFAHGLKLGLGSSAAASVALSKIVYLTQGIKDPEAILSLALKTHQHFSSKLGSGADIAASAFGASITFEKGAQINHQALLNLSWLWPNLIIIGTKQAQNTRDFVRKAEIFAHNNTHAATSFTAHCDTLIDRLIIEPSLLDAIAIFDELYELLGAFGRASGIDIVSKEHEKLHHLAKSMGASAKPSGAGGGDLGIALVPKKVRPDFINMCLEHGFEIIKLALC